LFPHIFPKDPVPDKFEPLTKCFTGKDGHVLAHRQTALEIGVEGTIVLLIASGEKVDWANVATVRGLKKEKMDWSLEEREGLLEETDRHYRPVGFLLHQYYSD
jgi:hypothetical protein